MAQDRDTDDAQSTDEKPAAPQSPAPFAGVGHTDDFEPDPPWDLTSADPPDPIALEADPAPPTPEQAEAALRDIERRAAWPRGVTADELARAAERCGRSHVWWLGLLRSGELPGPQPWDKPINTDDLKLDWINAGASPRVDTDHALDIKFGRAIRDLCPGAERFRAWRSESDRPWAFRFPALDECRERFLRATLAKARQTPSLAPFLRALPRP